MGQHNVDELIALLGDAERVPVSNADREAHSRDESFHEPQRKREW